jgi:hypothetical protein
MSMHAVDFVLGYNGRVVTGFQLRTSCERNSGDMGAEGNPSLSLKKSIDIGMQPNAAGQHVNYLEIYEPDVVADDLQPVLRDGASLFKIASSGSARQRSRLHTLGKTRCLGRSGL